MLRNRTVAVTEHPTLMEVGRFLQADLLGYLVEGFGPASDSMSSMPFTSALTSSAFSAETAMPSMPLESSSRNLSLAVTMATLRPAAEAAARVAVEGVVAHAGRGVFQNGYEAFAVDGLWAFRCGHAGQLGDLLVAMGTALPLVVIPAEDNRLGVDEARIHDPAGVLDQFSTQR